MMRLCHSMKVMFWNIHDQPFRFAQNGRLYCLDGIIDFELGTWEQKFDLIFFKFWEFV